MKKKSIIASLMFISVILIAVISLVDNPDKDDYSALTKKNSKLKKDLLEKYDADIISDTTFFTDTEKQLEILSNVVVLDSVLKGIVEEGGEYFLKAVLQSDSSHRIMVKLRLDEEGYKIYSERKSNTALIAAQINEIHNTQTLSEFNFDTPDSNYISLGKDVLLCGNCLELTEVINDYNLFLNN